MRSAWQYGSKLGNSRYRTGFEVTLHPDKPREPLRWRSPRVVFVNSMSDLFHPGVPDDFIWSLVDIVQTTPQHTYQVLTKRPKRAMRVFDGFKLPSNLWMGTSIEKDMYVFRADYLRKIDAEVRFLSCEPLIGPVPSLELDGIGWVIIGGESGPNHRPIESDWGSRHSRARFTQWRAFLL